MTRAEHLTWCKTRAMREFDYYAATDSAAAVRNAQASMLSDLGKHPETRDSQKVAAMLMLLPMHSRADVQRFVEGFA